MHDVYFCLGAPRLQILKSALRKPIFALSCKAGAKNWCSVIESESGSKPDITTSLHPSKWLEGLLIQDALRLVSGRRADLEKFQQLYGKGPYIRSNVKMAPRDYVAHNDIRIYSSVSYHILLVY